MSYRISDHVYSTTEITKVSRGKLHRVGRVIHQFAALKHLLIAVGVPCPSCRPKLFKGCPERLEIKDLFKSFPQLSSNIDVTMGFRVPGCCHCRNEYQKMRVEAREAYRLHALYTQVQSDPARTDDQKARFQLLAESRKQKVQHFLRQSEIYKRQREYLAKTKLLRSYIEPGVKQLYL